MKKEIRGITYNWYAVEGGEHFTDRSVGLFYGSLRCEKITEHEAMGEGDKWLYDICYSDGSSVRIFNPNQVFYKSSPSNSNQSN